MKMLGVWLVMMTRFIAAFLATTAVLAACAPGTDAQPAKHAARPATKDGPREVAILAAGCFWGVEHWMMMADGVVDIDVGYAGGSSTKPSYEQVSSGTTGHAEAVRIVFDPSVTSYEQLLLRFYRIHDPTSKNRQGNDHGSQYRSAIFPLTDAQRKLALAVTARVEMSGAWKAPITTTIETATSWTKAEEYHQDYLIKHTGGYDNHFMRKLAF